MRAIPPIAFIGAGRVAHTLSIAFARAGLPIVAIASRRRASAEALAARIDGCRATSLADAATEPLVFVTVPDDAIASVVSSLAPSPPSSPSSSLSSALPSLPASLPASSPAVLACVALPASSPPSPPSGSWHAGQSVVHCSGATEVAALDAALVAGAAIGGFHPLQTFADPDGAVDLLAGVAVAIEGPPALAATLDAIARRLGMRPIALPPGARAAYHGGASFAAGFVGSMIDEAVAMWRTFGVDEATALGALLPLAHGNLDAIAARGVAGAVSGPISRGDARVVRRHVDAFDRAGADHGRFYRELAYRQLRLALVARRIDADAARAIEAALAVADRNVD